MNMDKDIYRVDMGREIKGYTRNISEAITRLQGMTDRLTEIKDEVDTNADSIFDNPADQTWVNAQLIAARTVIQDFAATL